MWRKSKLKFNGVLSDACILDTCCVTNERSKVTCFAIKAGNLALLSVEAKTFYSVSLHIYAKVQKFSFDI